MLRIATNCKLNSKLVLWSGKVVQFGLDQRKLLYNDPFLYISTMLQGLLVYSIMEIMGQLHMI